MQDPEIPALSHYVPAFEGPEDKLTAKYPLQLITWKGKTVLIPPSMLTRGCKKFRRKNSG